MAKTNSTVQCPGEILLHLHPEEPLCKIDIFI